MSVDPNNPVPIYQQIVEHIYSAVAAGVHRPGEMLPSIRALALELVVNPNTVQRAYRELERQKLVETRRGRGMFVATDGKATAQVRSVAAVHARFCEGVRIGRSANIGSEGLDTIFRKVVDDAPAEERSPVERSES